MRVRRISEWHLHIKMVDGSSTTVTVNDPQVTQSWNILYIVGSYDERTAQGLTTFTKHGPCCIHSRGYVGTRLVHKSQKSDTMPRPARELAHLHAWGMMMCEPLKHGSCCMHSQGRGYHAMASQKLSKSACMGNEESATQRLLVRQVNQPPPLVANICISCKNEPQS